MLSRTFIVGRACSALARQAGSARLMSAHGHGHGHDQLYADRAPLPTMNDLPVPSGSWQQANANKQTRYNIQLLASVVFFFATFGYVYQANIIDFNLAPERKN